MSAAIALVAGKAMDKSRLRSSSRRPVRADSALLLSGGGSFGFFHLGVINALRNAAALPRVLSGASAGSLMAAIIATRSERELDRLDDDMLGFAGFTKPSPNEAYTDAKLADDIARVIPDVTFAEAQEISGRALNVSIAGQHGGGLICGPLDTPDVLVRDAVRASCSVPFVFPPALIHERRAGVRRPFRNGALWVDGSLYADVPSAAIKRRYRLNRVIVSLVNPAITPFVTESPGMTRRMIGAMTKKATLAWTRMAQLGTMGLPKAGAALDTMYRMIDQPYGGDIVLTPSRRFAKIRQILDQPSEATARGLARHGEDRVRARIDELIAAA